MVVITREQAICMFYCEEYNEDNVTRLTKEVDAIKNVDICHFDDPLTPMLLCTRTINQNPFKIHKYQKRESVKYETDLSTDESPKIGNTIELIKFLNTIYLPFDPKNEEVYENKCVTSNEILATVWKYSDLHEDKGVIGFTKWCQNRNIKFASSPIKRRKTENQRKRTRSLYVVKEKYIENIIKDITEYREKYKEHIQKLKKKTTTS